MTETAATPVELSDNEKYILDRMEYTARYWEKLRDEAKARVADGTSSDWVALGELAVVYGRDGEYRGLINFIEGIKSGRWSVEGVLKSWMESVTDELLRIRTSNSTSAAANLIQLEKLTALQTSHQLVKGWIAFLND